MPFWLRPIPAQNPEQHPATKPITGLQSTDQLIDTTANQQPSANDQDNITDLIAPTADTFLATSCTSVKYVVPATVPVSTLTRAVLLIKPKPWTPLRLFILKCELSKHPNKAFVKLIEHLCCFIGYKGPQFSYHANNLVSAYQQPEVIDTILKKESQLGQILGLFQTPPLPNFRTLGLGLVPKHDGGWRIIYHLSAPPYIALTILLILMIILYHTVL